MKRFSNQTGASLIMIIAVTAIVVVLSTAMIALVAQAKNSRTRDRQRAQTFNAAEAAVDDALARLAAGWPKTVGGSPVWGAAQEQTFKTAYLANGLAAQYPTLRIKESFYDNSNSPTPVDTVIDATDYTYDANGDGMMYVEVQAQDGAKSTRIRVLAQRQPVSLGLPRGVAFYTTSTLWSHGGSDVFGVDADGVPPAGTQVKAYVGTNYTNDGSAKPAPNVFTYVGGTAPNMANVFPNSSVPPLASVLNQAIIDSLKIAAQSASPTNYYTSGSQVDEKSGFTRTNSADPDTIVPLPPDTTKHDLSGLVYIKTTGDINWQPQNQYNSPSYPGILIIDGANLKCTSNGDYYGLIYLTGGITDLGTLNVHGMVISAGGNQCELGGSQILNYNDRVWQNLSSMYTASVRIVPNTWRELKPLTGQF